MSLWLNFRFQIGFDFSYFCPQRNAIRFTPGEGMSSVMSMGSVIPVYEHGICYEYGIC